MNWFIRTGLLLGAFIFFLFFFNWLGLRGDHLWIIASIFTVGVDIKLDIHDLT